MTIYVFYSFYYFIFLYARRKVVIHGGKVFLRREGNFSLPKRKVEENFPGTKTRSGEIITQIIHENIVFFAQNPTYPA